MAHEDAGNAPKTRRRDVSSGWADWVGVIPWKHFVTPTFDPKRRFPVGRDLAERETFELCGLMCRASRRQITKEAGGLGNVRCSDNLGPLVTSVRQELEAAAAPSPCPQ